MDSPVAPIQFERPSIRASLDARFWLVAVLATIGSLVRYGIVAAILPNPIFGREIAPDAAAIAIWLLSSPLIGLLAATYMPLPRGRSNAGRSTAPIGGSGKLTAGGVATFLAIGCPLCNKIVLLALGTGGAMNLFAPIQPLIGIAALGLPGVTLAWRLRRRAAGCAVPAPAVR